MCGEFQSVCGLSSSLLPTPLGMDTHLEHSYWAMGRGPRSKTTLLKVQLSRKLAPKGAYFVASVTPLNYEEDLEQAMRVSGFQ